MNKTPTHRGSKRKFSIHGGKTHVELFWHHGYRKYGAAVIHAPTGEWDFVFGSKKTLFPKIRQLAAWLAHPEIQEVSARILGKKDSIRHLAAFWADEIHIRKTPPSRDVFVHVKTPRTKQPSPDAVSQSNTGSPHTP